MSWLPVLLGLMLGAGAVLTWQGVRVLSDKTLTQAQRRKGFWRLNSGLMLVAVSIIGFSRFAGR